MIPREILAQVRRIEIKTGRLVNETFAGKYLSAFKGRGMEFAQVREYVPGDDIRTIDWNVTARIGRPFVREYQEERELTLIVACDLSGSQFFGSDRKLKRETAAELAAVIAFSALKNNDKVGLFLFTDEGERFLPPRKGHKHVLTIIRDLLAFEPKHRGTDLGASLDTLNRMLHRRAIIVLVSDFQDSGFESSLRRTAKKHDLIPVLIEDPREESIPALPAFLELEDPETGERLLVNARSAGLRYGAARRRETARAAVTDLFKSSGIDYIRIRTDRPFVDPIVRFFRERSRRIR
ncbi:MAG: DUF58 domain-containing protein [Elusimicrobiota bacterium]